MQEVGIEPEADETQRQLGGLIEVPVEQFTQAAEATGATALKGLADVIPFGIKLAVEVRTEDEYGNSASGNYTQHSTRTVTRKPGLTDSSSEWDSDK